MTFCESNRYKWDYVAEIFVDLQDLHSNDEIPGIINDINRFSKFPRISDVEMRLARTLKIQGYFIRVIDSPIRFLEIGRQE